MNEWFCMYFVTLLLEFNRPSQKLMEHIDAQEVRRVEMARRRQVAEEQLEAMNSNLGEMDLLCARPPILGPVRV